MFVVKDAKGKVRGTYNSFGHAKANCGHTWTIWRRSPVTVTTVLDVQVLVKSDKVSRLRDKVAAVRVGGQHSEFLVHKIERDTGRFTEERVW